MSVASHTTEDPRVQHTREVVLDAVRELARAEGIHAVTAQRLSQDTGLSRSTIHRHWPDMRVLLIEAFADPEPYLDTPVLGDLRTDLAVDSHAFRLMLEDRGTLAVLLNLMSEAITDDGFAEVVRAHSDVHFDRLRRVLAAGQASGELRDDIEIDVAASLLAGPILFRRVALGEAITPAFVDHVVERFIAAHAPHAPQPPTRAASTPQEH
jgi:AcrR family transcriptional regulator